MYFGGGKPQKSLKQCEIPFFFFRRNQLFFPFFGEQVLKSDFSVFKNMSAVFYQYCEKCLLLTPTEVSNTTEIHFENNNLFQLPLKTEMAKKKLVITDIVIIMNETVSTSLKSLLWLPTVNAEYKNFPQCLNCIISCSWLNQ